MNLIQNASKQKSSFPTTYSLFPIPHSLLPIALFSLFFFLSACTFDYGEKDSFGEEIPNLVMENVEYVRVISSDPLARVKADRVERYEKQNIMKLENVEFEQYGEKGKEINILGRAGYAQIEIDTGNILLDRGVMLDVETEDIILETYQLEWEDETRSLYSGDHNEVYIYRENGTRFTGTGLRIDAQRRTWEFVSGVRGTYIYDD